jgi:hypothetical protein
MQIKGGEVIKKLLAVGMIAGVLFAGSTFTTEKASAARFNEEPQHVYVYKPEPPTKPHCSEVVFWNVIKVAHKVVTSL